MMGNKKERSSRSQGVCITVKKTPDGGTLYSMDGNDQVMSAGHLRAILGAAPYESPVFVGEAEQEIREVAITPRGVSLRLSLLGWGYYRGAAAWEESEQGRVAKHGER